MRLGERTYSLVLRTADPPVVPVPWLKERQLCFELLPRKRKLGSVRCSRIRVKARPEVLGQWVLVDEPCRFGFWTPRVSLPPTVEPPGAGVNAELV